MCDWFVAVLSHFKDLLAVNSRAERLPNRYLIEGGFPRIQVQHDDIARREPVVVMRGITRDERLIYIWRKEAGPVHSALRKQQIGACVRGVCRIAKLINIRLAGLPVMSILAEYVELRIKRLQREWP